MKYQMTFLDVQKKKSKGGIATARNIQEAERDSKSLCAGCGWIFVKVSPSVKEGKI